ncbi:MAG: BolA/IbaG family iron-sulfur metabolism protein [Halobacteriota archaeon]
MDVDAVRELVEAEIEDASVDVVRDDHDDERSEGAHFGVSVVSPEFEGMSKVERHRRVHAALDDHIGDEIHAVEIRARTPEEAEG